MQPAAFLTFVGALVTFFEVTITKHFTVFFFQVAHSLAKVVEEFSLH